jgi:hypothetical protein
MNGVLDGVLHGVLGLVQYVVCSPSFCDFRSGGNVTADTAQILGSAASRAMPAAPAPACKSTKLHMKLQHSTLVSAPAASV